MKTSLRPLAALTGCLCLGLSAGAFGDTASSRSAFAPGPSKTVRFGDLDISSAAGAEALYGRIVAAARAVCRREVYTHTMECRAKAVDDAVSGVGSPLLGSVHRAALQPRGAREELASSRP